MKTCVDYYVKKGSNVFVAYLDCTKGFDKVDHNGIFVKLIERKLPLCFLMLLMHWYSNLSARCKWNNSFSETFCVTTGIKQGGVLSPHIFAVYLDDLILELKKSGCGCYLIEQFLAAILYADDLALLALNLTALQ